MEAGETPIKVRIAPAGAAGSHPHLGSTHLSVFDAIQSHQVLPLDAQVGVSGFQGQRGQTLQNALSVALSKMTLTIPFCHDR